MTRKPDFTTNREKRIIEIANEYDRLAGSDWEKVVWYDWKVESLLKAIEEAIGLKQVDCCQSCADANTDDIEFIECKKFHFIPNNNEICKFYKKARQEDQT